MQLEDGEATGTRAREPNTQIRSPLHKKQNTDSDVHVDNDSEPRPELSSQSQDHEDQDPSVDSDGEEPTAMSKKMRNHIRELKREQARQIHDSSSSSLEEQKSVTSVREWSSDLQLADGDLSLNLGKVNKERDVPSSAAVPNPSSGENSGH